MEEGGPEAPIYPFQSKETQYPAFPALKRGKNKKGSQIQDPEEDRERRFHDQVEIIQKIL